MNLPGEETTLGERPAARTASPSTSAGFLAGFTERGPIDEAKLCVSITDLEDKFGGRLQGDPELYDAADAAFHEGSTAIYVGRTTGDNPVKATKILVDEAGKTCLTVTAKDVGEYGNSIKAQVTVAEGKFTVIVSREGHVLESSGAKTTVEEAIAWAEKTAEWVDLAGGESKLSPKAQTVTLAGGKAELGSADGSNLITTFALFPKDWGPGQVAVPNFAGDEEAHLVAAVHCALNNRRGLLDDVQSADANELIATATPLRAAENDGARFIALFGSWAIIPGLTQGTERTCPYSGVQMGIIARSESEGNNPNKPAAGSKRGKARWALGLDVVFSKGDRELLHAAGVTCSVLKRGVPTTFDDRTLVDPLADKDWLSFASSRMVMAVSELTRQVLEDFEFEDIDGHGYIFNDLAGQIGGRACKGFYEEDALYGATPQEAFAVNTGPQVNTPASIEAEEIKAQVAVRTSPKGNMLTAEVVKVPISESV